MIIANIHERLVCPNYEQKGKPAIEVVRMSKGQKKDFATTANEIVCIFEGRMKFSFRDYPDYRGQKRQLIFLPAGSIYKREALTDCLLIVFCIRQAVMWCSNYSAKQLYKHERNKHASDYLPKTSRLGILEINARIWHFLEGIKNCIVDGLRCRCWFDLKVKELFTFIRMYYPKEEIADFLYLILSGDVAFSEYIRLHWSHCHSVQQMAASMNMTPKQFSNRFVAVFNKTPYRWMQEGRSRIVLQEITATGNRPWPYHLQHRHRLYGVLERLQMGKPLPGYGRYRAEIALRELRPAKPAP